MYATPKSKEDILKTLKANSFFPKFDGSYAEDYCGEFLYIPFTPNMFNFSGCRLRIKIHNMKKRIYMNGKDLWFKTWFEPDSFEYEKDEPGYYLSKLGVGDRVYIANEKTGHITTNKIQEINKEFGLIYTNNIWFCVDSGKGIGTIVEDIYTDINNFHFYNTLTKHTILSIKTDNDDDVKKLFKKVAVYKLIKKLINLNEIGNFTMIDETIKDWGKK